MAQALKESSAAWVEALAAVHADLEHAAAAASSINASGDNDDDEE